jgi:hypothetical protein
MADTLTQTVIEWLNGGDYKAESIEVSGAITITTYLMNLELGFIYIIDDTIILYPNMAIAANCWFDEGLSFNLADPNVFEQFNNALQRLEHIAKVIL